jgi:hypothetical protein
MAMELMSMLLITMFALGAVFGLIGTLIYIRWSDKRVRQFIAHHARDVVVKEMERYSVREG